MGLEAFVIVGRVPHIAPHKAAIDPPYRRTWERSTLGPDPRPGLSIPAVGEWRSHPHMIRGAAVNWRRNQTGRHGTSARDRISPGLARVCLLDRLRPVGHDSRRYSAVGLVGDHRWHRLFATRRRRPDGADVLLGTTRLRRGSRAGGQAGRAVAEAPRFLALRAFASSSHFGQRQPFGLMNSSKYSSP